MKNGSTVAAFESAFAEYVGAKFAIALVNGTATLHTALVALGHIPGGTQVAVPPLTMSATTIAVLHAEMIPVFEDIDPHTWLMKPKPSTCTDAMIAVSLYGLHQPYAGSYVIDDAAQTLRPHSGAPFTSYSFQASKILALGEGGMLVTDDEELATRAREFSSLGYRMRANQPRIDPAILKDPNYERHHSVGYNYRMNDLTAMAGLCAFDCMEFPLTMEDGADAYVVYPNGLDGLREIRRRCAALYRQAIQGCPWIVPQFVPEGSSHDYWAFAIALHDKALWHPFTDSIVKHGGEMPYGAWKLTYQERPFQHLVSHLRSAETTDQGVLRPAGGTPMGICPIAEDLQLRLVQAQTNNIESAERNAEAWYKAIQEIGG